MAVKVDVAAAICVLAALSVFGAEGFFSVRQKGNGVWTFVDPDGKASPSTKTNASTLFPTV